MSNSHKSNSISLTREQEKAASKFFGKHISPEKQLVLLVVCLLVSLLPMLKGLSLWESIPLMVESGIRDASGVDDSLPRWALVFAIPGLFAVLTLICHGQLYLHQRAEKLPPTPIRLLGRWTTAIIGLLFGTWVIGRGAGQSLSTRDGGLLLLSIACLLLGSHFFDVKESSLLALKPHAGSGEALRKKLNRFAGVCYLLAGLLFGVQLQFGMQAAAVLLLPAAVALLLPFGAIYFLRS